MPEPDDYVTIRTGETARNKAREIKDKLGVTWSTFLDRAADALDPDSDS